MSNSCVITVPDYRKNHSIPGIYIHSRGDYAFVECFCEYCKMQDFRSPDEDNIGLARLTQVLANYFSEGLTVSVCESGSFMTDHGVYMIKDWKIHDWVHDGWYGENEKPVSFDEKSKIIFLQEINEKQPLWMMLTDEYIEEWVKKELKAETIKYFKDSIIKK